MRIVSLTPTATAIARALGLGPRLVGLGHPDAGGGARRPLTVASPVRRLTGLRSRTLDRLATAAVADGTTLVRLDEEAFGACRPDLVLLTEPDDPLGVAERDVRRAAATLPSAPAIVIVDPASVEGVFHGITTVAAHAGVEAAGLRVVARLRARLARIERRVQRRRDAGQRPPRAAVLEWLDPLRGSGRWMPELVRRAGGWEVLGREGDRPVATSWREIAEIDPEVLFLAPRGLDVRAGLEAWSRVRRPAGWARLEAVRRGQVVLVDPAYLSYPGPAIVDGVGILAEILDPEALEATPPSIAWVPVE